MRQECFSVKSTQLLRGKDEQSQENQTNNAGHFLCGENYEQLDPLDTIRVSQTTMNLSLQAGALENAVHILDCNYA